MYAADPDPYCYPGTAILKNIPGIRDEAALERFEIAMTSERSGEPLPAGRFSLRHYQAIHRHLFQDVYRWAGRFRTVRISRGASAFCYPEYIPSEMKRVFGELRQSGFLRGRDLETFAAGAAHVLADLNAIHAFRDGNGRSQLAFIALLAARVGRPLDLRRLDAKAFLKAMIVSFQGDEQPLTRQIGDLVKRWAL